MGNTRAIRTARFRRSTLAALAALTTRAGLAALVALLLCVAPGSAQAQKKRARASASTEQAASDATEADATETDATETDAFDEDADAPRAQWFLGGYYRHNWIPSYMLKPWLTRAPSITNDGFGLLISHRTAGGFTAQIGVGYMPYNVSGAFTAKSQLIQDTEYIQSDLALLHLTGALLWPIEFTPWLGLEFGFGLDFGILTGSVTRSEAYPDATGHFHACQAAHVPVVFGPPNPSQPGSAPIEYCDTPAANGRAVNSAGAPLDSRGVPLTTNNANEKGEQYGVRDPRVPPVMAFPMLPLLALRFSPHEQIAFKFEFSFGIAQIWAGASVHVGFGTGRKPVPEAKPKAHEPEVAPPQITGRVLGTLKDKATQQPIAQATVKTKRALSALETDEHGIFIVDNLEPGPIHFEISHPDFDSAPCETMVPESGGSVTVFCYLTAKPNEGAISGQVQDEQAVPVAAARVQILGPATSTVVTGPEGLFALPDAPAGTYRIRVDADGYLMQLVEVEVTPRDTALPKVILVKKPTASLVTIKATEIYISQQINFETNSAEIGASSDALMREIADAMLRNENIQLIEIQGHTDNKGGRPHNQQLSQARSESVRNWLVTAGVPGDRLTARGYGQDMPIRPNSNAADRAKNRRVQFIILKQAGKP